MDKIVNRPTASDVKVELTINGQLQSMTVEP